MHSNLINETKVTAAMKLLTAVGDWQHDIRVRPLSTRAFVLVGHGYKSFAQGYGQDGLTSLTLRASDPTTVEVQTLVAYPDHIGLGSTAMRRLCDLADQLGVTLWLDAQPFGDTCTEAPLRRGLLP